MLYCMGVVRPSEMSSGCWVPIGQILTGPGQKINYGHRWGVRGHTMGAGKRRKNQEKIGSRSLHKSEREKNWVGCNISGAPSSLWTVRKTPRTLDPPTKYSSRNKINWIRLYAFYWLRGSWERTRAQPPVPPDWIKHVQVRSEIIEL